VWGQLTIEIAENERRCADMRQNIGGQRAPVILVALPDFAPPFPPALTRAPCMIRRRFSRSPPDTKRPSGKRGEPIVSACSQPIRL
jgi:hypothetical protein